MLLTRFAEVDPDAALDFARGLDSQTTRNTAIGLIVGEISRTDPAMAMEILRGIDSAADFQGVLDALNSANLGDMTSDLVDLIHDRGGVEIGWSYGQMFRKWTIRDPEAAMAKIATLARHERSQALEGIASGLAANASEATLSWIEQLGSESERRHFLTILIRQVAAIDPQRALSLIGGPDGSDRTNHIRSIASQWIIRDPDAARRWIDTLEAGERFAAFESTPERLSTDPDWSREFVGGLPASERRERLVMNLVHHMARRDPAAAALWMDSLPVGSRNKNARRELLEQWSYRDPAGAAEHLSKEPIEGENASLAGRVAGSWIVEDPQAAIDWINSLEVSDSAQSSVFGNAFSTWAKRDAPAASQYILQLEGETRSSAIKSLMYGWTGNNPRQAREWADSLEDPASREQALTTFVRSATRSAPQEAAAGLLDLTRDATAEAADSVLTSSARDIAGALASQDPAEAARWVDTLPDFRGRPSSLHTVAQSWGRSDPEAAMNWVAGLSPGDDRDGAISGLVGPLGRQDAASAFRLASDIQDDDLRVDAIFEAFDYYFRADRVAAWAALRSSNISEEAKQELASSYADE